MSVGEGGVPPVQTRTRRLRRRAAGSLASMIRTVGAPLKWVMASETSSRQTSGGSTCRMHTFLAPAATRAQVWLQPLQWNIGSVHRQADSGVRRFSIVIAIAFK